MRAGLIAAGTALTAICAGQLPEGPAQFRDGARTGTATATAGPYSGLFSPSPSISPPQFRFRFDPPGPDSRDRRPRRKVVCGMTLILVEPGSDPSMAKPTPDRGVTYTMRGYPPPACGNHER